MATGTNFDPDAGLVNGQLGVGGPFQLPPETLPKTATIDVEVLRNGRLVTQGKGRIFGNGRWSGLLDAGDAKAGEELIGQATLNFSSDDDGRWTYHWSTTITVQDGSPRPARPGVSRYGAGSEHGQVNPLDPNPPRREPDQTRDRFGRLFP